MKTQKMKTIDIKKEDFEAYERVRKSGKTNMFMTNTVRFLSGLSQDQVMAIMKNYDEYKEMFERGSD